MDVSRVTPFLADLGGGKNLCFLELRAIAQMTEPSLVTVSPHDYDSTTVGLAATLHVSAAIPNFLITEYFVNFEDRGREVGAGAFEVKAGHIRVPTAPGLGVDIDEAALARYPARPSSGRRTPSPDQEDP